MDLVEWIASWAKGITIAVIIATIIEMILPENSNKKYIKMVIGVYILFTVITPIITVIKGKDYEFNMEDYEKYFENTYQASSDKIVQNNDENIEEIYINNIKEDMKQKLMNKGYKVENISITIQTNEENYGDIEKMDLRLVKDEIREVNSISVDKVEIGNSTNTSNKNETAQLSNLEIKELKQYLSDTYNVAKNNIEIN